MRCSLCGAEGPHFGTGPNGETICCAACLFNPLGCRCKYGEYGVAETHDHPDFPMFDTTDDDPAHYDASDYYEPEDHLC